MTPRMLFAAAVLSGGAALSGQAVNADGPLLSFPLDCVPGEECYIQTLVDVQPGEGHADFQCTHAARDDHRGTDFALRSLADLENNIAVLAAAPGTVQGVRDGMPDIASNAPNAPDITGRECGNGVAIVHGNGWRTQYCHLKEGSVVVRQGQRVERGETIGILGLSGWTSYPHLHMNLTRNGEIVDPFDPESDPTCVPPPDSQWLNDPPFSPGGFVRAGVSGIQPSYDVIKQGGYAEKTVPASAPVMILWAQVYQVTEGDSLRMIITGPDDFTFDSTVAFEKWQEQAMRFAGRRLRGAGWPQGEYVGTFLLSRKSALVASEVISFSVN
ncbi:MAG: M23 family metallopeptidase [Pseudomonadota bacterium]